MSIELGQPDGVQPDGVQPTFASGAEVTVAVVKRFQLLVDAEGEHELRFPDTTKDPSSGRKVELDLYDLIVNARLGNELVDLGEHMRPQIPNGFAYECSVEGTTGAREPFYKTTVGQTFKDGGVTWTCRAAGALGLRPIADVSGAVEPSDALTLHDVTIIESRKIAATYRGGSDGVDYLVAFAFTLDGESKVVRQLVKCRK
jgi:hypothetical protein